MAASKVSLKLLIDTKGKRVLFAEAGKDFVDFLFNILNLPMGTVISLLTKNGMVGCLGNLYDSVEKLDETYIEPDQNKNSLLKPIIPTCASQNPLLLLNGTASTVKRYYSCGNSNNYSVYGHNAQHLYVTENPSNVCPSCQYLMSRELQYVSGEAEKVKLGGGYVKGVVTYLVMDDLSVMPLSTISSITLLNKFNVKEVANLEEKVVYLDMAEGVKLLKASLESKMALTSVFFGIKSE